MLVGKGFQSWGHHCEMTVIPFYRLDNRTSIRKNIGINKGNMMSFMTILA